MCICRALDLVELFRNYALLSFLLFLIFSLTCLRYLVGIFIGSCDTSTMVCAAPLIEKEAGSSAGMQ